MSLLTTGDLNVGVKDTVDPKPILEAFVPLRVVLELIDLTVISAEADSGIAERRRFD